MISPGKSNKFFLLARLLFLSAFLLTLKIHAEKLPVKLYTSNDGLASSAVTDVFRDSNGFLWFTTRDGLSRFDGREFVNFSLNSSSNALTFWTILEARDGTFWISTSEGLFRAKPNHNPEVKPDDSNYKTGGTLRLNAEKASNVRATVLFEDNAGRLWAGAGEFFLVAENGNIVQQKVELGEEIRGNRQHPNAVSIAQTNDGSLWIATIRGIVRRLPEGKIIFYPITDLSDQDGSQVIQTDQSGRIWTINNGNLYVFQPEKIEEIVDLPNFSSRPLKLSEQILSVSGKISLPNQTGELFRFKVAEPSIINGVFQSSDGKMWVAAREDLYLIEGDNYQRLRDTSGIPAWTGKIEEDLNGDLWFGTSGAMKFVRRGLTSFNTSGGLTGTNIQNIQQSADGTIYFVHGVDWRISKITENGIETVKLKLPESAKMLWTSNAAIIDNDENWWALAENGLYQFADKNKNPDRIYSVENGLKATSQYCAFKDSQGNIWFSSRGRSEWNGLTKYDPKTKEFKAFTSADGFPESQSPVSFAEDKAGNLWFGFYNGGLARYSNGRFNDFSNAEGLPKGGVFGLYADEKGRLWIGTSRDGVARVDNTSTEKLTFQHYTTEQGLISNNVRTLTGDLQGNIYAGTVRGVSRISPETGNIRHFTTADGLAADFVTTSFRDKKGTIWFGTSDGISRLETQTDFRPNSPPQVWISGLNIAGTHYSISEFGQKEAGGIEVSADKNNLQIEFMSVGGANRYQYKLEGAENADWSNLSEQRTVNFANLAPNNYRFLVRAVNEFGQINENPAVVSFTISPPFWKTWWFITSVILLIGLAVFSLDRYRVFKTRQVQTAYDELQKAEKERREAEFALQKSREERLAELERVRTRIATDLHDDIGSSLTQIAVLSSVAQGAKKDSKGFDESLENISEISNELVESMSDIVWAINPRKDNLRDLVQRMRRFAADIFSAKGIKFQFTAPDVETNVQVGANIRREIFSIFKESVNNSVKHSNCQKAKIDFRIEDEHIFLKIEDDGEGFDVREFFSESLSYTKGGNGLLNIKRRAGELGGNCRIDSESGKGTTVSLTIPLEREADGEIHTSQVAGETIRKID